MFPVYREHQRRQFVVKLNEEWQYILDRFQMKWTAPCFICSEKLLCSRYYLNEVILVRQVFTLFSAICNRHLEICQHVCAVLSEISQVLLAFNTIPVGRAICVIV